MFYPFNNQITHQSKLIYSGTALRLYVGPPVPVHMFFPEQFVLTCACTQARPRSPIPRLLSVHHAFNFGILLDGFSEKKNVHIIGTNNVLNPFSSLKLWVLHSPILNCVTYSSHLVPTNRQCNTHQGRRTIYTRTGLNSDTTGWTHWTSILYYVHFKARSGSFIHQVWQACIQSRDGLVQL